MIEMQLWRSIRDHLYPSRFNAHRPHLLKRPWLFGLLAITLISEGLIVGSIMTRQGPQVFLAAVVQSDIVMFTERARASEGGTPLEESELLNAAAQAKAEDMAARGYFSHKGPDGESPWTWLDEVGYAYVYAGENLAVRFKDSERVVDAWMASPTHRANIVKEQYQEIGVGLAEGIYKGEPATYIVQYFGTPAGAPVAAAAQDSVVAAVAEPGDVAGAETSVPGPAPKQSFVQTAMRAVAGALGDARSGATWVLGGVAALLVAVLGLTFAIRIQVQPTDLLVPGLAVALVVMGCLAANAKFLPADTQSASVIMAAGGEVGEGSAVERIYVGEQSP